MTEAIVSTNTISNGLKLPQLQNLCKRDPRAHESDYLAQVTRLESECNILSLSGQTPNHSNLIELIQFVAAVSSSCYVESGEARKRAQFFMEMLQNEAILQGHNTVVREVRRSFVSALILMRNKCGDNGKNNNNKVLVLEPLELLELFFNIMAQLSSVGSATAADKSLRETIHRHIVNDIRNVNKKGKNQKLNRQIQSFMHRVVSSVSDSEQPMSKSDDKSNLTSNAAAARRCVEMIVELYRRNVWTDERTIQILATAAESRVPAVMTRAIKFFLGIEERMDMDASRRADEEIGAAAAKVDLHLYSRKTKSRIRQTQKQIKNRKNKQEKFNPFVDEEDHGVEHSKKLFPAIEMLNDPQGLAENVFKGLRASGHSAYTFEIKLLLINFITRLVGNHELLLLPLYPFLQKYLGGHQRDVTAILAYTVQACHEYVPPDEVNGLLKAIAHNFITERCTGEQMAVGINAVRAICGRVPSVLSDDNNTDAREESTSTYMDVEAFVRDLAGYAKHKDRSVMIAGRSWVNFIRETHPSLLQGKDRGMVGSALRKNGQKPLRFGEQKVSCGVEGADLLVEYEAKKAAAKKSNSEYNGDSEDELDESEEVNDAIDDEEMDNSEEESIEDEAAPELVNLDEIDDDEEGKKDEEDDINNDLSEEQRKELQMKASSSRIFTSEDFEKMRKLVARQKEMQRDPRAKSKQKRLLAKTGTDFEELSGDESDDWDSESEDEIRITGVVKPEDIMASVRKKRLNKAERLEKVIAGREKFESKQRAGGSTNTEKKRKKNFVMSQFSYESRQRRNRKGGSRNTVGKRTKTFTTKSDNKKRRRKS